MIELGLQRISRLLAQTHLPWRAIHVAGTNGKGSICVYISGMLEAYNNSPFRQRSQQPPIRHGRFTSPHLIDRWDCISINQQPVSSALFHEIEKKVLQRNTNLQINASEFELLTATAFEIFTHEQVDIGVIEVGMGGRLDATNILGQPVESHPSTIRALPLVTAIAKIGLDHQNFLGSTLSAIAAEKAGILKPSVPLIYDPSNPDEVKRTFRSLASNLGSPEPTLPPLPPTAAAAAATTPPHTQNNTLVAYHATLLALQQLDRFSSSPQEADASTTALTRSLLSVPSQTIFPGRLQRLSIEPLTGRRNPILLDGAHNAQSAAVLAEAVAGLRGERSEVLQSEGAERSEDVSQSEVPNQNTAPNQSSAPSSRSKAAPAPVTFLLAASSTKDLPTLLQPLLQPGDRILTVEFGAVDGMPWVHAMDSLVVLEGARNILAGKGGDVEVERGGQADQAGEAFGKNLPAALKRASELAAEGPLVVAGSLYLVGDVLRVLREVTGTKEGGEL